MRKSKALAGCALAATLAGVAATPNDWENLAVNSINREPPRTYSMPLASEQAAFTDALEPETPFKVSLNGIWKISWAGNPELRVKDFYRTDFSDADWFTIDVPSCVEMRGFGSPGYVNVRYPHKLEWPFIKDRQSGKADYNPVSSYRRTFTVPAEWKGRETFLRFDGVYSAYYVWVNGKKVGYAEDSKLPSEFNITKFLKEGENLLAVEVYRWCDGSYLEDQDMYRFSGIFRDVTLWSMPKDGIWDFAVRTALKNGYQDATIEVTGCDGAEWKLYDAGRREIASGGKGAVEVNDVNLWSAEKPYLYTLVVKKGGDMRMRRVGFKEVKVAGNTILFNGRKIKFKGVNRHETNPDNGRTVSIDDMLRDITLFKMYNINTVRTCHYPDHHLWYDLCDRYGIYVCAEANVEGHEPGYAENGLGLFPEWMHTIVERNLRHVKFYRNHPSVTLWSMGNETGHGVCFTNAIAQVKALDPSRPIHWERGNPDADVDSRMYPTVEWLEERGRLGDKAPGDETMTDKYDRPANRQSAGKPFWMCEYAHAMGNAIGNFQEYWDVFYRYDSLSGGCIWDWIDQAVWKYTDNMGPDGKCERFLAYGGDWDEQPNDGPFNCNGVIDPQRNVTAKLIEVGHVHRNFVVDSDFNLENRFGFTYADEFDGVWEVVEDGIIVRKGTFVVPHIAPLSKGSLGLPHFKAKDGAETFVNVDFLLKEDTLWAKKGWPVARNQIALIPQDARPVAVKAAKPRITQDGKTLTAEFGGTKAVFCKRSGTLCELVMGGKTILKDPAPGVVAGPRLTCSRAFTDNDIWLRGRELESPGSFYLSGLTQLRYHARPVVVDGDRLRFTVEVTGSKSAGFTHVAEWTFGADGALTVKNTVTPHGTMPSALPRLGLSLKLDKALEGIRYYGRGPRENYIDRKTASFFGIYDSTVTDQYEGYVRPQDNGYKSAVRWAAFVAPDGKGVKFSASEPLFVQALHYSAEDLEFSRQRRGQQRFRAPLAKRDEVYLNLDIRQLGLGGGSCGPRPMDKYIFPVQNEEWTLKIEPYSKMRQDAAMAKPAMPAPDVKVALELPPGPNNPRNSEGAFMPLKDGRIMFIYSRYYGDSKSDHATADLAARYSSDNGATWTDKDEIVVKNHGGLNVMSVSLLRLKSGEIALFYLLKNSTTDCRPVMRRSFDEGKTWSAPVECITDEVAYYVLNNDRVIQLKDGRLLFAVSRHSFPDGRFDNKGEVVTYSSDDNGATWHRGKSSLKIVSPSGRQYAAQEPGVVELKDGSVLLWIRTSAGSQFMSRSTDRGETWSEPQPSWLRAPVSPATIKRLPSTGDLLVVWNDHEDRARDGRRTPLSAAISRDDGRTWEGARVIEGDPKGWYCYIAMQPLPDGTVLLGYCAYQGLAHSRIVKVPVDWFYAK